MHISNSLELRIRTLLSWTCLVLLGTMKLHSKVCVFHYLVLTSSKTCAEPQWRPETSRDEFWGADWSEWKPEPAPSNELPPGTSLLDAPIELPQKSSVSPSTSKWWRELETYAEDNESIAPTTVTATTNQRGPPRLPPDLLTPMILLAKPGEELDTIERIEEYARKARRRRCVPDRDDGQLDISRLREAVGKTNRMLQFLAKENAELVRKVKAKRSEMGIVSPPPDSGYDGTLQPWKWDENMEVMLLSEKTQQDIKGMDEESLRHGIRIGRQAREALLDRNWELSSELERPALR